MGRLIVVLTIVAALAGCDRANVTGIEDKERGGRARRPVEATMMPMCIALYRAGGTHDPASENYDPGVVDTALMHAPHTFVWEGSGPCDTLLYRYRVNDGAFSAWSEETSTVIDGLPDGGNEFVAQPGCPGTPGLAGEFWFVVNYDPDSRIVEPPEPSGTLTVGNGDTLWVRALAHDREELEGVGGGIAEVVIELDGYALSFEPPLPAEWWWSSSADEGSGHYIESRNSPQGGNASHLLRVYALDVDGRWESPLSDDDGRESLVFWYNHPPTVTVTFPAEGDTVGSDFTVFWEGHDPDGNVVWYQYVLDPWAHPYSTTEEEQVAYFGMVPGPHEFRVRARDDTGCWSETWTFVHFYVE